MSELGQASGADEGGARRQGAAVSCVFILLSACTGVIGEAPGPGGSGVNGPGTGATPGPGGGRGGSQGGPDQPGAGSTVGIGSGSAPAGPVTEPGPSAAPLRRLTTREYHNTVRDLFPTLTIPNQTFPPPTVVSGFENHELSLPPTSLLAEHELAAAEAIAALAVSGKSSWVSCASGEGLECAQSAALALMGRAYRRPVTSAEAERMRGFVDATFAVGTFDGTLGDVVQSVLVSPQFLYRVELGEGEGSASPLVALSEHEVASRLSYFLWGTMPDDTLFGLARGGRLSDAGTLRAQAERLLDDPRARVTVADFHRQWLELDRLDTLHLDPATFPQLDDTLRTSLRSSLEAFVQWSFWDQRSVAELFGSDRVFVDSTLAPFLGVTAGSDLVPTSVPNRKGLLTQPGLLASTSHGTLHSPILRGVQILRRFLCSNIPPPPPSVNTTVQSLPQDEPRTTREHFELTHKKAECAVCHDRIDGAGYTLENYDALGRYGTTENGLPIDATGALPLGSGPPTPVTGGVELGTALAASTEVRSCLANHWFRFAFGRAASAPSDRSEVAHLAESIAAGPGDPRALLLSIVDSSSFRTRPAVTP